jgi:hypothetical protein
MPPRLLKKFINISKDAIKFSNSDGQAVMQWAKSATLVGIRLTEPPNSRWALAHTAHPAANGITELS